MVLKSLTSGKNPLSNFDFFQFIQLLINLNNIRPLPKWRRYLTFQPLEKKKRYRSLSYKKLHKILPKGSIDGEFLRKLQKVKVEVTGPIKKHNFLKISELCTKTMFSDPVT